MLSNLKASPIRYLLVSSLVLLAIAFAVEAKIAWFGPITGPGSAIRAAKAFPSEAHLQSESSALHSNPLPIPASFTFLPIIAAVFFSFFSGIDRSRASRRAIRVLSTEYFSPLAFRAPPALF